MDESTARDLLRGERAATLRRVQTLAGSLSDIVSNTDGANSDDEHDPEGSTIAFERAQVSALLAAARASLEALDDALARLSDGTYGECQRCGGEIAPERLAARPAAVHCIACAGSSRVDR
jgi:RNA polymerase-binding transcription factor DksA